MNDLIDMLVSDDSPANISDGIKQILMTKASEKIEMVRPYVTSSLFGEVESED
jgi:hypothetical protein